MSITDDIQGTKTSDHVIEEPSNCRDFDRIAKDPDETGKPDGIIKDLVERKETLWLNPGLEQVPPRFELNGYKFVHMKAAQSRFMRFMPYIASAFPETEAKKGVIESDLIPIPGMREWLNGKGANIRGEVFLKDDAHLPIAGSVKARGGIHEVLKIAETLAQRAGMLWPTENYSKIDSDEFREFYSQYTIQVGSTGNLGISIGRSAARLGFRAIVHMSSDAKQWKKDLLRSEGVIVREYAGDYSQAVATGRKESEADPNSFFIDDENSEDLFFGYATAAMRVSVQLVKRNIPVDARHPLFLYLPCGVGGAPGGITYGFKQLFGSNVHCFFAEPVDAPCLLLGMESGQHEKISVQDIGLTGHTVADGLAVGRPSGFVCNMMESLVSGVFTVSDERMLEYQSKINETEGIRLEPSACAGFGGLSEIERTDGSFAKYLEENGLSDRMSDATHIVWATGGGLMP